MEDVLRVGRGEIVALEAGEENIVRETLDGVTVGERTVALVSPPSGRAPRIACLRFGQHAAAAQKEGWLQARWYEDAGKTVDEFLSYCDVWDVNPFEVGARRPMTRKEFVGHRRIVMRLLALRDLLPRLLIALSNGETRRVLLARALLKKPDVLVLGDPAAGLDGVQRERLKDILCALAKRGVAIVMTYRHEDEVPGRSPLRLRAANRKTPPENRAAPGAKAVVEISGLSLAFGKRTLFSDFSWTVREGERWVLRGDNGKGKTTLLSLICGDNPMAYAAGISVFGVRRKVGTGLAGIREKIGMVSPEMQAYLGADALGLVEDALRRRPRLLLLDEPFMNMDRVRRERAVSLVTAYLDAHPRAAAIIVCHRGDEIPPSFDKEVTL